MSTIPASSEFMALCRSQLRLLTEGLGASLSVVYMTEELEGSGESKLLPVVVYPETSAARAQSVGLAGSELMMEITPQMPSPSQTIN
jgi:hypothetical protein